MKIGVLGTGMVGQTLAGKLAELGHSVFVGTRDPAETVAPGAVAGGDHTIFASDNDAGAKKTVR